MHSRQDLPRVVHVVPALFGWENIFGGAERFALELARAMASRVPTRLVSFGSAPRDLRLGDLDVRVLKNWLPYRRLRLDPVAPSLLLELRSADIVHVHQPETMASSMALVHALALRKPIFSTHLGGAGFGLHRLFDITRLFDGHLHLSEYSRRVFGHEGLPSARAVYAGVDTDHFRPPAEPAVRDQVVYVGRLLPHKGINYLIEGIDPDIPLTIVGRHWRHALKYDRLLIDLAKGKKVNFVAGEAFPPGVWAPEGDNKIIAEACKKALCIVLPSVHETVFGDHHSIPELLGIVLLEGMACGAPAIVTSVCSLPEVVEDGVSGFVVPPNDPIALRDRIRWLRDHPEEARKMGAAARQRVLTKFNWSRVVDRCLEAYGLGDRAAQARGGEREPAAAQPQQG